jgi:thiol-disulfide isomerase/thioredoxin
MFEPMRRITWYLLAAGLCLGLRAAAEPGPSRGPYLPAPGEFEPVGQAVVELLQSRDAARFAKALSPTVEDYHAVVSTNRLAGNEDPSKAMQMTQAFQRKKVQDSAKAVLARLDALHVTFTNGNWRAIASMPSQFGQRHWDNLQEKADSIPWAEAVEFVLKTDTAPNSSTNGDFSIAVRGLLKFPAGWRCSEGLQWASFPANVAGAETVRDLALLKKVARHEGFNDKNDPALRKLGEGVAHFIHEGDTNVFAHEVLFVNDMVWAQFKKSGVPGPSRREFDEEMAKQAREQLQKAGLVAKQMQDAGIDLKDAEVQLLEAAVERSQSHGAPDSMDGVMGLQFRVKLGVKSSRKSGNGTPLSGEYILAAKQIMRFGEQWRLMDDLHWRQLPEGLLDAKSAAALGLENYVAENGTLPPGRLAPEIEFRRLSDAQAMKLSSLRGKVVVLDFWATWCGPCQAPMAELQKLPAAHPSWQDKVAIMPLSIDDTLAAVRAHVEKRGWTNTFNVWAGEGGWRAAPPQAFRVSGVPTTYILDAEGRIVRAGHPASMDIEGEVDALLKRVGH